MFRWNLNLGTKARTAGGARPAVHGVLSRTLLASEHGWCPVDDLGVGDRVWTFDNGLRPITAITPMLLWADPDARQQPAAFTVPAGALGNEAELTFLGSEGLLLECENASDLMGDPFAVIPVAALEGVCGIAENPVPKSRVLYTLSFEQEEAVYIDSGLLVHCPQTDHAGTDGEARYDVKTVQAARDILTDLDLAELALREADEEFFGEMASDRVA